MTEEVAMNEIHTRIRVGTDHRISGTAPDEVPPGEHDVIINVQASSASADRALEDKDLPRHDLGPWPDRLTLRREEIYGDNGR
jgi:hypothetical protein